MVHPNTILNTYPPEGLISKIEAIPVTKLNVYVDIKNICTSLFIDSVAQEIVKSSEESEVDTTILQSILLYASWWKEFGKLRNLKTKVFFCNDKGHSIYHQQIDKNYKLNRSISAKTLPFYFEDLNRIRHLNNEMAELVCDKLPDVYFFNLKNLEADFLSYYLITRRFNDNETIHIICSSDKDMFQTLIRDNIFLLYKLKTVNKYLTKDTFFMHFLQISNKSERSKNKILELLKHISAEDFVLILSIIGDMGDNVRGVKGLGPVKVVEMFSNRELVDKHVGNLNEVISRVLNDDGLIFKNTENLDEKLPRNWKLAIENNRVVTNSFKLISFEFLCRWLEQRNTLYQIEKLKSIDNTLNIKNHNGNIIFNNPQALMLGLKRINSLQLTIEDLNPLFI